MHQLRVGDTSVAVGMLWKRSGRAECVPSLKLPEYGEDGERIKYTLTLETRYSIIEKNLGRTPDKTSSDEHKYLRIKDLKDKCDALILTNTTASPFADVYLASTPKVEEPISAADYLSELG